MLFKEFGDEGNPTVILLHGGGLSWWSQKDLIDGLKDEYHVVAPVIDGHGEDGGTLFSTIEESAEKLIQYVDTHCGGRVFALGGLSIGAQIAVKILSQRPDIARYAVIESALVYPIKGAAALTAPMFSLFYGLVKRKWFSRLQAKTLFVPEHMFQDYYEDSCKMSKQTLINIARSNGSYKLSPAVEKTEAKVLIIAGEKELRIMKKSAQALHDAIPASRLFVAPGMKHGELSLVYPQQYLKQVKEFFSREV